MERAKEGLIESRVISGLDYKHGDLFLFGLSENNPCKIPAILSLVRTLEPGNRVNSRAIPFRLEQFPDELISFHPIGNPLFLLEPFIDKLGIEPRYTEYQERVPTFEPFKVKSISIGRLNVINALSLDSKLKHYADFMKEGYLVSERGPIGKLLCENNYGFLLPNRLRFRRPLYVDLGIPQLI